MMKVCSSAPPSTFWRNGQSSSVGGDEAKSFRAFSTRTPLIAKRLFSTGWRTASAR